MVEWNPAAQNHRTVPPTWIVVMLLPLDWSTKLRPPCPTLTVAICDPDGVGVGVGAGAVGVGCGGVGVGVDAAGGV